METYENFAMRVERLVGLRPEEIPGAPPEELLGAHIIARRGDEYIIFVGYPDEDENNQQTWPANAARRVDLSIVHFDRWVDLTAKKLVFRGFFDHLPESLR